MKKFLLGKDSELRICPYSAVAGVALGFALQSATAATVPLDLERVFNTPTNLPSHDAIIDLSIATWEYDTNTRLVTGSGLYVGQIQINPALPGQLFTHEIVDMVIGGGTIAQASSYTCIEGTFGASFGASLCGNYSFGENGDNESTFSYGPGIEFNRTIGGDDVIQGLQQNLQDQYSFMDTTFFDGSTLVVSNGLFEFTFAVIPVPPAIWLFGSALGLFGWMRRKTP